MIFLQIARAALIVLVAAAYFLRNSRPELFIFLRFNVLWIFIAYLLLTLTIRYFERRRRKTGGGGEATSTPWTCEVCENENSAEELRCPRCTVPRPGV